jgi:hypothetical protein
VDPMPGGAAPGDARAASMYSRIRQAGRAPHGGHGVSPASEERQGGAHRGVEVRQCRRSQSGLRERLLRVFAISLHTATERAQGD